MKAVRITEYLDIDLEKETWQCNRCDFELGSTRHSYMRGCLVHERPGSEIYGQPVELQVGQVVSYAPDPRFMKVLEFYCPSCGTMLEIQYLPPGHPIPDDMQLDIEKLKEKYQ